MDSNSDTCAGSQKGNIFALVDVQYQVKTCNINVIKVPDGKYHMVRYNGI